MSTAIGKAALVLSVNGAGLRSGLAAEGSAIRKWAEGAAKGVGAAFKGVGPALGVGLGLGGAVQGVREVVDTLDEVSKSGAAAKAFGLSTEQFTGIAGVAKTVGEGQREFIESLVTLGKVAAEGAAGQGEVATAWFKSLNLDAQQFKALRLDEQFFTVFEAIKKVQDPAERVRALMVAFGEDGGKYLLPLLAKSGTEIRAMAKGFEIGADQVEKATAASKAWSSAQRDIDRAWREFATGAAPAVEVVADKVGRLAKGWNEAAAAMDRVNARSKGMGGGGGGGWVPSADQVGEALNVWATFAGDLAWDAVWGSGGARRNKGPQLVDELVGRGPPPPPPKPVGPSAGPSLGKWQAELLLAVASAKKLQDLLGPDLGRGFARALPWAKAVRQQAAGLAELADHWRLPVWQPKGPEPQTRFDNPALLKGTAAEVSARVRNDLGANGPQQQMLREQQRGNGLLQDVRNELVDINRRIDAGGLAAV